jgi:hypothetical protein
MFVIHEGACDVKGRLAVLTFGWVAVAVMVRFGRWVKGFRGFAPDFGVVLPGEACRVKRLVGARG